MNINKPLFIPLKREFFEAFKDGTKTWELRGINNNFNEKTVVLERKTILALGYTKTRIEGKISNIVLMDAGNEIKQIAIWNNIIPSTINASDFIEYYLNKYEHFIIFKIQLKEKSK